MNPDRAKLGCSFKGAVAYITHDPQQATTRDRVSFTHCHNLRTDDPDKAAKLMAHTAMHAEDLKRQAGQPATGRKMEKPVYHLSLNWHPDEKPSKDEMIKAGQEALSALKVQDHEAVFAAHTDKAHQHLHIVVNRVHPEKGTSPSLSNDLRILQKWAYEYEKQQGTIQCKNREAIYEEDAEVRKQAQERQKQERQELKKEGQAKPKSRQQWQAEQATPNARSLRATEIKTKYSNQASKLAEHSKSMYAKQRQEKKALYEWYKIEKDRLWKSRGSDLAKAWQEAKHSQQNAWERLQERQKAEYGALMKEVRQANYHRRKMPQTLLSFIGGVVDMWLSNKQLEQQRQRHQQERTVLSSYRKGEQERSVGITKEGYQAQMQNLRQYYLKEKSDMQQRHSAEKQDIRQNWTRLNANRQAEWDSFRSVLGVFRKEENSQKSNSKLKETFNRKTQQQTETAQKQEQQREKPRDRSFSR